jgi:natural product precursor
MKKEFRKKLSLNKQTIANLNNKEMQSIKGGEEAFGSSENGRICICLTTLLNCDWTELGCDTEHNCPTGPL